MKIIRFNESVIEDRRVEIKDYFYNIIDDYDDIVTFNILRMNDSWYNVIMNFKNQPTNNIIINNEIDNNIDEIISFNENKVKILKETKSSISGLLEIKDILEIKFNQGPSGVEIGIYFESNDDKFFDVNDHEILLLDVNKLKSTLNRKFNVTISNAKIYEESYSDEDFQNIFEMTFTDINPKTRRDIIEYIMSLSYFSSMMGKDVKLAKASSSDHGSISFELSDYISEFRY